jgi:hypothetical protein
LKRNKLLTIDGEPVTTKYRCAVDKDIMSGYYLISLSRWYKVEEGQFSGRVTYGNFYHKVLLYNPFTGEFYQDKKSRLPRGEWERPICFVGRNTLWIYLGHQVVFIPLFMIITAIMRACYGV